MARRAIGFRHEVLLLLPTSLLILVAISVFTLLAYRSSIQLLTDDRQREAQSMAEHLARGIDPASLPSPAELADLTVLASGAAVIDSKGAALVRAGELPEMHLLSPLGDQPPDGSTAVGPGAQGLEDRVAGFASHGPAGDRLVLRVDLPAHRLAAQRRSLRVLSVVVLGIDLALALLVLLFLGRLLAPWDRLLAEAHRIGGDEPRGQDEVAYLIDTFQRAIEVSLQPPDPEEDIRALQRTLAPSLASGLLLLDRDGGVLALNPVGQSLLGVEPPEPGQPLAELLAGHSELSALLVDSEKSPDRLECEIETAGGKRTLGVTAHPLRRDDGSIRGRLVLFADLTETRRRAGEERLAKNLEEIGALAAGLAHELRNSLATLRGYLTLAARRPEEGTLADYLVEMRREADHLQRILEDFLTFARPGSTRAERLDLRELVLRTLGDPALGEPGARLLEDGEESELEVHGDPQLLERALRNLVANAVQAQKRNDIEEKVEVRILRQDDECTIRIEDRGPGIPEDLRDRLFLPFVTAREDGVGLGLALAHRIVGLHQGRVRLEDRQGGGVRAEIMLPLSKLLQ